MKINIEPFRKKYPEYEVQWDILENFFASYNNDFFSTKEVLESCDKDIDVYVAMWTVVALDKLCDANLLLRRWAKKSSNSDILFEHLGDSDLTDVIPMFLFNEKI